MAASYIGDTHNFVSLLLSFFAFSTKAIVVFMSLTVVDDNCSFIHSLAGVELIILSTVHRKKYKFVHNETVCIQTWANGYRILNMGEIFNSYHIYTEKGSMDVQLVKIFAVIVYL